MQEYKNEYERLNSPRFKHKKTPSKPRPNKVDQSYKDQCDLKVAIKHFFRTGKTQMRNKGMYLDTTQCKCLVDAKMEMQEQMAKLPQHLRRRFENPAQLEQFLKKAEGGDIKTIQEGIKLGMFKQPEPKTTIPEPKVNEPEPKTN